MLSVSQAAEILGISPARVRKMIADGVIGAEKVGKTWSIPENEVAARLDARPKAGRPKKDSAGRRDGTCGKKDLHAELHKLYSQLKQGDFTRPSASALALVHDKDEAGFMLRVYDYFLELKQREEIAEGVY